ncbi:MULTISPECIES: phage minor capsid protein [Peribacillus]|uniref:phage minor capsid protein n=1 Tax=Peribacillus TaxID=2675229 RepID=UPI00351ED53A
MLSKLDQATKTGIIDSAGRWWKPEVYADMVVRTKMASTQRGTATNNALGRDVYYGVISRHGARDACAMWEGRVVKLVREAPGDYPVSGDISRRELFPPNCKHVISPVEDQKDYPNNLLNSYRWVFEYFVIISMNSSIVIQCILR